MNKDFLKKIPLFFELDETDIDELAGYVKRNVVDPQKPIFWMDEFGDTLFIIESGQVTISYTDEKGKDVTMAILKSGDFFGELSLIDGGPHTGTARATTETILYTLDRTTFYRFLDKHPTISMKLLGVLAKRLRANTFRMRGINNLNDEPEETTRFGRIIDRLAHVVTSGYFLTLCTVFIIVWIIIQVYLYRIYFHEEVSFIDRPPTFFILGFIFTLTSFLFTVLILSSQRRQAKNDRIRNVIESQVNLKAQTEVMKLHLKMDRLLQLLRKVPGMEMVEEDDDSVLK
ncbi:MAG: cyclic nucleotide-binding domain-containing protein [Flavisolibacter sp.]|jgi:CRP/FNR family cyclic AMP-dependent transcriptional regulator